MLKRNHASSQGSHPNRENPRPTKKKKSRTIHVETFGLIFEAVDDEVEDAIARQPSRVRKGYKGAKGDSLVKVNEAASKLPLSGVARSYLPITTIRDAIEHVAAKAHETGIGTTIRRLGQRAPRVATMCSGTESPILFLKDFVHFLDGNHDEQLHFTHVFSAEIEPWKQAYIQRNLAPPLLYRDICEFNGKDTPQTAYGVPMPVPRDIDLLVAGFSCKDLSNLNNHKRTLDQQGQSGQTAAAIFKFAVAAHVPIVVFENVIGADHWRQIAEDWNAKGYATKWITVDTKDYYIPQTRRRVYMVCIRRDSMKSHAATDKAVTDWEKLMKKFQHPATASVEHFLLPKSNPRYFKAKAEMMRSTMKDAESSTKGWALSHVQHLSVRERLNLGHARPVTEWTESGTCTGADFGYKRCIVRETERVKDSLDMSYLRAARQDYDLHYKSQIMNYSQNIDRNLGRPRFGISGCLTPNGMFYTSPFGRFIFGMEALMLQGIPIDALHLTSEMQRNLQDLAGNAMTLTVVGPAIVSAIISGAQAIPERADNPRLKNSSAIIDVIPPLDPNHKRTKVVTVDAQQRQSTLPSAQLKPMHTAFDCRGTPHHGFTALEPMTRKSPGRFIECVRDQLPLRLRLLIVLKLHQFSTRKAEEWSWLSKSISAATTNDLFFASVTRGRFWTVTYRSSKACLRLVVSSTEFSWFLYVDPSEEVTEWPEQWATFLAEPVARARLLMPLKPSQNILDARWELRLPVQSDFSAVIEGPELVPSWKQRLGMNDSNDEQVCSRLTIKTTQTKLGIDGDYWFLPDCGTACGTLYVKKVKDARTVYLFLDPDFVSEPKDDLYVFSYSKDRREPLDPPRDVIARLGDPITSKDSKREIAMWRPPKHVSAIEVHCSSGGYWVTASDCTWTKPLSIRPQCVLAPDPFAIPTNIDKYWRPGAYQTVQEYDESSTFKPIAYLVTKFATLGFPATAWTPVKLSCPGGTCQICAPSVAENVHNAADPAAAFQTIQYERAMKSKPRGLLAQVKVSNNQGHLLVGLNIQALAHRALAKLDDHVSELKKFEFRIDPAWQEELANKIEPFVLRNNRDDEEVNHIFPNPGGQSPKTLRREQGRSLTWMIAREDYESATFMETFIEEACISSLCLRAEVRATKAICVRGGLLADDVGYGKTVTTLALIDYQRKRQNFQPPLETQRIALKATLIFVTNSTLDQWRQEIENFLHPHQDEFIVVKDLAEVKRLNLAAFCKAKIILASWHMLAEDSYLSSLRKMTGCNKRKKGLLFELCHFDRIVVDEFTYLNQSQRSLIAALSASKRWILSATPSLRYFLGVKDVATLLGVWLGPANVRWEISNRHKDESLRADISQSEKFHRRLENRSWAWSCEGMAIARNFLDIVARKNSAEINDIPVQHKLRVVSLASDHRAFITELENRLHASDMQLFSSAYTWLSNLWKRQISDALRKRLSAEEALLILSTQIDSKLVANPALGRGEHLQSLLDIWSDAVLHAISLQDYVKSRAEDFRSLIKSIMELKCDYGDGEALSLILNAAITSQDRVRASTPEVLVPLASQSVRFLMERQVSANLAAKFKNKGHEENFEIAKEMVVGRIASSKHDSHLIGLFKELFRLIELLKTEILADKRGLRFLENFQTIERLVQRRIANRHLRTLDCGHEPSSPISVSLAIDCGHTLCSLCNDKLRYDPSCPAEKCLLSLARHQILSARDIKKDGIVREWNAKTWPQHSHYHSPIEYGTVRGTKLEVIVRLVKHEIPEDDQVILFAQYDVVLNQLKELFKLNGITAEPETQKEAKTPDAGNFIKKFQTDKRVKVLLLNSSTESCAGSNLKNANHIIFVSPFHATSADQFMASETQCIGRACRFGQKKEVYCCRFAVARTIEVDILQMRMKKKIIFDENMRQWCLKNKADLTDQERDDQDWSSLLSSFFQLA
ncbi:hypothetical protein MMC25_004516 [Agyrium rufum]|nr:hypothetical protein [Agyrium rufum]